MILVRSRERWGSGTDRFTAQSGPVVCASGTALLVVGWSA